MVVPDEMAGGKKEHEAGRPADNGAPESRFQATQDQILQLLKQVMQRLTIKLGIVFIDTPNITMACNEIRHEIPFDEILNEAQKRSDRVIAFAFVNPNCPEALLRVFENKGLISVVCVRPKYDDVRTGYDPLDDKLKLLMTTFADIGDVFVIASEDADFNPTIAALRAKNKTVVRAWIHQSGCQLITDDGRGSKTTLALMESGNHQFVRRIPKSSRR
jgi:predicted TIM-barrel fold metal-dependent hydrolase